MSSTDLKADKLSLSYSIWMGILFLVFAARKEILLEFDGVGLVLVLLSMAIAGIAWPAYLAMNVLGRHRKRVVSLLAAPIVAYMFCWMLAELGIDAQRAHFEIRKPFYLHQ